MARWLKVVGVVFACVMLLSAAGVTLVYTAQPTSYRVSRIRTMPVPADVLRPHLVDLRAMNAWVKHFADPHDPPHFTFSTNSSGVGAWVERADSESTSRMTIDEVTPTSVRLSNVNHGRFGTGHATVELLLREKGAASTEVEYALGGTLSGVPRLLWPVVELERTVGPQLSESLERLEVTCRP